MIIQAFRAVQFLTGYWVENPNGLSAGQGGHLYQSQPAITQQGQRPLPTPPHMGLLADVTLGVYHRDPQQPVTTFVTMNKVTGVTES